VSFGYLGEGREAKIVELWGSQHVSIVERLEYIKMNIDIDINVD